jgi:hypothetical protein
MNFADASLGSTRPFLVPRPSPRHNSAFAAAASWMLGCVAAEARLVDAISTRRLVAIPQPRGVPLAVLALLKRSC